MAEGGGLLNLAALHQPIFRYPDKYCFVGLSQSRLALLYAPVPRNAAGLGGSLGGNSLRTVDGNAARAMTPLRTLRRFGKNWQGRFCVRV